MNIDAATELKRNCAGDAITTKGIENTFHTQNHDNSFSLMLCVVFPV